MSNIIKISIPLEKVVVFAEKAVREYNKDARKSKCIEKTFERCGQHIWDEDLSAFQEHLSGLKKDSMYRALLNNAKVEDLSLSL